MGPTLSITSLDEMQQGALQLDKLLDIMPLEMLMALSWSLSLAASARMASLAASMAF
jgi:hypothetical protein